MTLAFKHPILHLDVLAADGRRQAEQRVFCRWKRRSVLVDHCRSCRHRDAANQGTAHASTVDCTLPVSGESPFCDPAGERTEVGTLLSDGILVVHHSTSLSDVLDVARRQSLRSVAVVDDAHAMVGTVHTAASVGCRTIECHEEVGALMSTAMSVHERTPVRAALRFLAASHARDATVVSDAGVPIGVFRDIDGLRWIARAREPRCG